MRIKTTTYVVKSPSGNYTIEITKVVGAKRRELVRVLPKRK